MLARSFCLLGLVVSTSAFSLTPPSHCIDVEQGQGPNGLRVEGPTYVALDESRQFKGDYPFHFPTPYSDKVTFFNSEMGEVGRSSTNLESNAYHDVIFYYDRGANWVWVQSDNDINSCSKMRVYVSEPPEGTKISLGGGPSIRVSIDAKIDTLFSKNAREGNGKPSLRYMFDSEIPGVSTQYLNTESEQVTFHPRVSGGYYVGVNISDGSSSYYLDLGFVPYSGGQGCTNCGDKP